MMSLYNKSTDYKIVNETAAYKMANKTDSYDFIRVAHTFVPSVGVMGDDDFYIFGDDGSYIFGDDQ